jgi:hypothetical protein
VNQPGRIKIPVVQPGQTMDEPPQDFDALLGWLGAAIDQLENWEDEAAREQVFALLKGVDLMHRQGLERLLQLVTKLGGRGLTERVIQDEMVRTVLDLYDLPQYRESDPW